MNKKLKRILATVSAVAMCATSVVSMSAGALYTFKDRVVRPETTEFYAGIYGETIKFHLWQEATDYFDNEDVKIYISDTLVNDFGEEYTKTFRATHVHYGTTDYCSVELGSFSAYRLTNEDDTSSLEKYLSDNNIVYEKTEWSDSNKIYVKQYKETSDDTLEQIYTDDEYFELLQKIKEDTGFITGWMGPSASVQITETENTLPEPTLSGDANEDGDVNMADAVLIMQTLSNPNEYKLTPQGMANADIAGDGDGVTAMDALTIQLSIINQ